jgi:hypothetical protein
MAGRVCPQPLVLRALLDQDNRSAVLTALPTKICHEGYSVARAYLRGSGEGRGSFYWTSLEISMDWLLS